METKIVLHNSVSLDCSFIGFHPNMDLHYRIVNHYKPNIYLAGSNTARSGIELFGKMLPDETANDTQKPKKDKSLPFWVISDTKGSLKDLLHHYRRLDCCRDLVILASKSTPSDYLKYLDERHYDYIITGDNFINYKSALKELITKYQSSTIVVDSGSILGYILLNENLIDEISLIVSPEIIGIHSKNLFGELKTKINLSCSHCEKFPDGNIWITYEVKK